LQPLPNNDLHKFPSEKRKGIVGTTIVHLVLLLVLIIVGYTAPPPPENEEGILVNFGTDETGFGMIEPSPPVIAEATTTPPAANITETQEDEPLLTQDMEDAPEVKKVDPDIEKKKLEKIEADRKLKEQVEKEKIRKEQEEIERKRIETEQKRQTDIINRTRNALANSKNAGTNSSSEGDTGGPGNQGVTSGSVDSKVRGDGSGLGDNGILFDLGGRGYQALPPPKYDYQGEGKVVVEVSVDRKGKVIIAIPGTKGSTTLDEYLLKAAKDAAMKTVFKAKPDAPATQKGTITYNFILK
jgi:colicin import membrane protein